MKYLFPVLAVWLSMLLPQFASADSFTEASSAFCERMKGCAASEMGDLDNMSDDMKAQIMSSLDGMCASMQEPFERVRQFNELIDSAAACLNSMAAMTCEALDAAQGEDVTPECKSYRLEAAKYE